ncbi:MAG: peroxide stress protein YaaA [Gammaproteobacteria bacterium]|nr:peroxide stress protein YaaA [Gammaproteobacteria bacterium]
MLSVISPSKNLDFKSRATSRKKTEPIFLNQAAELVDTMRQMGADDIKSLMNINDELANLNEERFHSWDTDLRGTKSAVLAFRGDVYLGLDAPTLTEGDLTSAQRRIRILSGLYGLLRPMDRIHPYRLEMGLPIQSNGFENLYQFWGARIADHLNEELSQHRNPILVNLASDEYFKVIDTSRIDHPIVQCQFLDKFRDNYRFMSYYGKRARGLMARHIVTQKIDNLAGLKRFSSNGYQFNMDRSSKTKLVFTRDEPIPAQSQKA